MSRRRRWPVFGAALVVIIGGWLAIAYVILPPLWRHHENQPALAAKPMLTRTMQGIPGDPINVGLVGTKSEVIRALAQAGWRPADAVTLVSSFKIGASVALNRAYPAAPVSTLLYDGKPQALAFEKASGTSAKRRHHVRFWLSLADGKEGRPVWVGAASYDRGVGLSRYTGQITHHVGPDLDAERNLLIDDLAEAKTLTAIYRVAGIGPTTRGRNGGGDLYFTDGDIAMGVIAPGNAMVTSAPAVVPDSVPVAAKNQIWSVLADLGRDLHVLPTNRQSASESKTQDAQDAAAMDRGP